MKCFFNPNGKQIVSLENVSHINAESRTKSINIHYNPLFENTSGEVNTIPISSEEEMNRFMKMIFKILSEEKEEEKN